jgi:methionine-R-sulfoxide reductase
MHFSKIMILTVCGMVLPLAAWAQESTSAPAKTPKKLTPIQEYVTEHGGTELPFDNEYWNNHEDGIYVDVKTGDPLFSSLDKYDSKTGWPSFTKPIKPNVLQSTPDGTGGMSRTEVKSSDSGAHLGHVFEDGPADKGGKRFCINSASLRFIPKDKLAQEGYGEYLSLFDKK